MSNTTYRPTRIATIHDVKKNLVSIGDELDIQPKDYRGNLASDAPCIFGFYHFMDNYCNHGSGEWRHVDGVDLWINITPHPEGKKWQDCNTTWRLNADKPMRGVWEK